MLEEGKIDGALSDPVTGAMIFVLIMVHHSPASSGGTYERTRGDVTLLVAHLDAAYNLARWLMRNESEAEDLVQEAYLRAISRFAGFRGGDGRAWLLTIVRNCCYDRLKQKGSAQNRDFDEALHGGDRHNPNPETALLLAERSELVRQSLAKLPAEYREVLVLRELEQLSYREIGDIAGIPLGTVMSRLSRGRQRLEQILLDHTESASLDVAVGSNVLSFRDVGGGDTMAVTPGT
jgi:RNA polymerase sigma-70 factor (ECF subfamily)